MMRMSRRMRGKMMRMSWRNAKRWKYRWNQPPMKTLQAVAKWPAFLQAHAVSAWSESGQWMDNDWLMRDRRSPRIIRHHLSLVNDDLTNGSGSRWGRYLQTDGLTIDDLMSSYCIVYSIQRNLLTGQSQTQLVELLACHFISVCNLAWAGTTYRHIRHCLGPRAQGGPRASGGKGEKEGERKKGKRKKRRRERGRKRGRKGGRKRGRKKRKRKRKRRKEKKKGKGKRNRGKEWDFFLLMHHFSLDWELNCLKEILDFIVLMLMLLLC